MAGQEAGGADSRSLWFNPPADRESGRRALTRERVVAEALAVISAEGAQALSMRSIAARLGVVPGALYRHVRSKEQLYDLVLDAVLGEVGGQADPGAPWAAQVGGLARRLRAVLENHPGIAALLKARDPVSPASLAVAEAFLAPLTAAGLPGRRAALAFRLVYDYTVGFALGDPTSPAEQRLRDSATRRELHAFLRSLPAGRFPALAAYGTYAWANDRDQRFNSGLDTLFRGLQAELGLALAPPVAGLQVGEPQGRAREPGRTARASADRPDLTRSAGGQLIPAHHWLPPTRQLVSGFAGRTGCSGRHKPGSARGVSHGPRGASGIRGSPRSRSESPFC